MGAGMVSELLTHTRVEPCHCQVEGTLLPTHTYITVHPFPLNQWVGTFSPTTTLSAPNEHEWSLQPTPLPPQMSGSVSIAHPPFPN